MKNRRRSLFVVMAFMICGLSGQAKGANEDAACFKDSIRGISLESWGWNGGYMTKDADTALQYIKDEGANTVTVLRPYGVDLTTDHIDQTIDPEGKHGAPSDDIMIHAIQHAQALGLDVVLKLHFTDPVKGDVLANAVYVPQDPSTFFTDYKQVALENAALAEKYNVKLLVLGTEMGGGLTADEKFKPYFEDMIAAVRKVFHGKLTFATQISTHAARIAGSNPVFSYVGCIDKKRGRNWCISSNEADYFSFWKDLDYIGIDMYPNFTTKSSPSRDDLMAGLHNDVDGLDMIKLMETIQQKNGGKPILVTEIGASSVDGAQACSGCWPDRSKTPDFDLQANIIATDAAGLCQAKQSGQLNLAGVMWWAVDAFEDSEARKSPLHIDETGFPFKGKPAGDVIKSYFGGASPQ